MLLASFISGLAGEPGKQARYAAPCTVQEALRIAPTVEQAEKLEKRHGVFFVELGVKKSYLGHKGCRSGTEPQGHEKADQSTQTEAAVKCHRCGGVGHVARNCVTKKKNPHQAGGKGRDAPPSLISVYTEKDFHSPQLEQDGLPMVKVRIGGVNKQLLVDSGAEDSLIQPDIRGGKIKPSTSATIGVSRSIMRWKGEREICFVLNGYAYEHTFGILPLPPYIDGVLGMDFLMKMQASINLGKIGKGSKVNPQSTGARTVSRWGQAT
jgi:hypothetical protein